jgi:hypothetical protein
MWATHGFLGKIAWIVRYALHPGYKLYTESIAIHGNR